MISALNFNPLKKGILRGFFDLRYHGLTIKGVRLMAGKKGLWIALPQREINKDGERAWVDQLYLTAPEMDLDHKKEPEQLVEDKVSVELTSAERHLLWNLLCERMARDEKLKAKLGVERDRLDDIPF